MLALTLLLSLSPAVAQPRDVGRVQAGEDLVCWRDLQRDHPHDVDALLAFIEDFPSSPLAELAYGRLVALDAELPSDFRGNLARVSSAYHHHQEALARQPAGVAVATLDLHRQQDPALPEVALPARVDPAPRVEVGLGVSTSPGLYASLGGRVGPISVVGRGLFSDAGASAGAALRYDPWRYWRLSPFAEADWMSHSVGGNLGVSRSLSESFAVDLAAGTVWDLEDPHLEWQLRVGIAQTL